MPCDRKGLQAEVIRQSNHVCRKLVQIVAGDAPGPVAEIITALGRSNQ